MRFRKPSTDIIEEIVALMTPTVEITDVVTSGSQHTLSVCNPYWIQRGMVLTINGNDYTVTSVTYPNTVVVTGSAPITVTSFTLTAPYFFHGTPLATSEEMEQIPDAADKTPMVWMMEGYTDRNFYDDRNPYDRELTCRLFGLTQKLEESETTDQAYDGCIEPMRRMMEYFVERINGVPGTANLDDFIYDFIHYAKFGVYITMKGTPKALFADNLGGVELPLERLKLYRRQSCAEDCD